MSVAGLLTTLRNNNMYNSATKEVFGSNIPHVVMVMNFDEAVDQAINQFGNAALVFGGGLTTGKVTNALFKKQALFKGSQEAKKKLADFLKTNKGKWFRFGKSFAIYSFIASYVISSPFLRNFITSKRTKATSFVEMTGLKEKTKQSEAELKRREKTFITKFAKVFGIGLGISGSILGLTALAMKKNLKIPNLAKVFGQKVVNKVDKSLLLEEAKFSKFQNWPTYLFWALPAYIGLYAGSRGKIEKQETLMKAAGFGLMFMILPDQIKNLFNKFVKREHFKIIGPKKNLEYLAQLISGIMFYGSMPTLIALFSRKARAEKAGVLDNKKHFMPRNLRLNIRERGLQGYLREVEHRKQLVG